MWNAQNVQPLLCYDLGVSCIVLGTQSPRLGVVFWMKEICDLEAKYIDRVWAWDMARAIPCVDENLYLCEV